MLDSGDRVERGAEVAGRAEPGEQPDLPQFERADFQNPELRPYLDRYIRGSGGRDAESRVELMKLLWDALGSEFGGRHELYEVNYSGSTEENRLTALAIARETGLADRMQAMAGLPGRVRP